MNHTLYTIALATLLNACGSQTEKTPLPAAGQAIPVTLAPVQQGGMSREITASGLLYTEDESKLSFKTGGVVSSVLVNEGDYVEAGQVLATIKPAEINAQVTQVQLSVQKAERDYQRLLNLYNDSVATLEQLQNAKTGLDIARQGLAAASFNEQYVKIYAPASGFVVKKLMHAGEIAGPGMPVVVLNHVSAASRWILKAGVSDAAWASIRTGDSATVQFDAFPGKTFAASVSRRSLTADPASGSFTIELKIAFTGETPATGMFGRATIATAGTVQTTVIPYAALLEADGNRGYVFVTPDKKTVQKVQVTLGKLYPDRVEITKGLEQYSHVVVAGSAFLHENAAIIVQQ